MLIRFNVYDFSLYSYIYILIIIYLLCFKIIIYHILYHNILKVNLSTYHSRVIFDTHICIIGKESWKNKIIKMQKMIQDFILDFLSLNM